MEDEEPEEESKEEKVAASLNVSSTENMTNDSVKNDVINTDEKKGISLPKEETVAVEEKVLPSSDEPKAKMEKPKRKDKKKRNFVPIIN
jgi:hypothetical protein